MTDPFSITSSALPSPTRVLAFRGTEALSELYHFEIHLLVEDPAFDMAAALGADATLSIDRDEGQPVRFHGILATLETVAELARGPVYRAVLVPRLWQLTLTRHSRVFVDESAPGILQEVLHGAGLEVNDYTLRLAASYPRLPHVCQYQESSFAFLARRMEREGMYYFFEQGESRERLVIVDDRGFHEALSPDPVRYFRVSGAGASGNAGLRSFTCKHTSIAGRVHVKDADYLRPTFDVKGQAAASDRAEEIHLYGENFITPDEGARLARVRAEELKARQVVFRGAGDVLFLRPGYTFKLQEHPRFDGEYLTTELSHTGSSLGGLGEAKELLGLDGEPDEAYRVEVVAIPRSAPFRPERRTPVPRIYGTERAVIDGEADHDYAQIDEHGRYLVKIHFDESPAKNGKASTRIRMMQPHGGNPESFHFPLRKGTEVLLTFEGGDPDRPVIAGVVPNLHNPTGVTSKNATRNIIQTGGGNRVQIEDREGKQHVRLSSPHLNSFLHLGAPNGDHNWIGNTDGNMYTIAGQDTETGIGGSRLTVIGDAQGTFTNATSSTPVAASPMDPQLMGEALAIAGKTKPDSAGNLTVSSGAPVAAGTITVTETGTGTPDTTIAVPAAGASGSTPGSVTGSGGPSGVTIDFANAPASTFTLHLTPTPTLATPAVPAMGTTPAVAAKIATGILPDPDSRLGYRAGSDIKLLSGDNVTKTEYDNISAIRGDNISHIHGHSYAVIGVSPDGTPVPDAPALGSQPIQSTIVYGDVETTINGARTTTVNGNATTHLIGAIHNTSVVGNRVTELAGTDTSLTAGLKTSVVLGGNASVVIGGDFSLKWPFWVAFTAGPHFKMHAAQTHLSPTTSEQIATALRDVVTHVEINVTRVTNITMNVEVHGVHMRQAGSVIDQMGDYVLLPGFASIG